MELHHGIINVDSEQGRGTEFVIRLPLGKEHLQEAEIVDTPQIPPQGGTEGGVPAKGELEGGVGAADAELAVDELAETVEQPSEASKPSEGSAEKTVILVVEDNADVRNYIRQHLEPTYEVAQAKDGVEGLNIALKTIPDLIISDVMMPNLDGYELCGKLKKDINTSHIPIILLTAKAGEQDKLAGLETGADDYLIKPFNSGELLARVKNLIELRRKLHEKYHRDFLLQPSEISVESMDNEFLRKAHDLVEEHIDDAEFSVEDFAKQIAMSRSNLFRKLRALVNQSPNDFIRSLRLKRAAQLLKQNAGNITEIAFQVGFSNSAYFTQCFHEQFGCPPSKYRKSKTS